MDGRGIPTKFNEIDFGTAQGSGSFEAYLSILLAGINSRSVCYSDQAAFRITAFRLKSYSTSEVPDIPVSASSPSLSDELQCLVGLAPPLFERPAEGVVSAVRTGGARTEFVPNEPASDEHVFRFPLVGETHPFLRDACMSEAAFDAAALAWIQDIAELRQERKAFFVRSVLRGVDISDVPLLPVGEAPDWGARQEKLLSGGSRIQPLSSVSATEPRICGLALSWSLQAKVWRFADRRGALSPVGFFLGDNADWVVDGNGHPSDVYEYLARVCNLTCKFCYLYGNPDTLAIARGKKVAPASEIETRLKYYDARKKRSLFKAQWEINEFLIDPKLDPTLRELRKRTDSTFFFVTNGNPLTEKCVALLRDVAPVDLIVSLNAADPELRQEMMSEGRSRSQTAVKSLALLKYAELPYGISIAAFPDIKLDQFEQVISLAVEHSAAFVRVNLPGYTDALPPEPPFSTEDRWLEVIEWVRNARRKFNVPIISIPSAFEANVVDGPQTEAQIWGTVPNSPAERAGLKPGDVITSMGIFPVRSRTELISLGMLISKPMILGVRRGADEFSVTIDPGAEPVYPALRPVIGKYMFPLGIVAAPSLGALDADMIRDQMADTRAESALIITSPLMENAARALIQAYLPDLADSISWTIARNDYLGGNIMVMDMCTVGDIARAIDREFKGGVRPDVVLVPGSAFNGGGRDIAGRHWSDLETTFGTPVRLLKCQSFLF